jgi:hypothetical protein
VNKRELHLARIRSALAQIAQLEALYPNVRDPDFKQWKQTTWQSLKELFDATTYALRFAQLRFNAAPARYGSRFRHEDPGEIWSGAFKQAHTILEQALEEGALAESTTGSIVAAPSDVVPTGPESFDASNVFVSRPTWVSEEFRAGLDGFIGMLEGMGLHPRTLGTTDYPNKAPLDEVIALLDKCSGAVILGLPQISVTSGRLKGSIIAEELLLPTEWNHIEAGLAYARGLPLLAIHHLGVRRGIFDLGAMSTFLYERDLSLPAWPLAKDLQGAIAKWKQECLGAQT